MSTSSSSTPNSTPKVHIYFIAAAIIIGLILIILAIKAIVSPAVPPDSVTKDPIKGSPTAVVIIKEYSDFQCPACAKIFPQLKQLEQEFGDQIAIEYNDFPLVQLHPNAFAGAEAAQCAFDQDKFWEYHDILFIKQSDWSIQQDPTQALLGYAGELGLDTARFEQCTSNRDKKATIEEDMKEGDKAQITSTPTLFINGERYTGVGTYESLAQAVRLKLGPQANNQNSSIQANTNASTNATTNQVSQ